MFSNSALDSQGAEEEDEEKDEEEPAEEPKGIKEKEQAAQKEGSEPEETAEGTKQAEQKGQAAAVLTQIMGRQEHHRWESVGFLNLGFS